MSLHSLSLVPVNPDWFYLPGFTYLLLAHPGSSRKIQEGREMFVCVCVCVYVCGKMTTFMEAFHCRCCQNTSNQASYMKTEPVSLHHCSVEIISSVQHEKRMLTASWWRPHEMASCVDGVCGSLLSRYINRGTTGSVTTYSARSL